MILSTIIHIYQPVVSSPDSNLSAMSVAEGKEAVGALRTPASTSRARKRIYSSENDAKPVQHGSHLCFFLVPQYQGIIVQVLGSNKSDLTHPEKSVISSAAAAAAPPLPRAGMLRPRPA